MTTPDNGESPPEVDLTKSDPAGEAPFDPYRFGKPDRPIPPEYAPPGYVPPTPEVSPTSPYGPSSPYGPGPSGPSPYGPGPSGGQAPYGPAPYGQPPYGQPPYGPPGQEPHGTPPPYPGQYPGGYGPPPPGYSGYGPARGSNGKAVAALVLGIASIILFWLSVLDAVPVILALVFGLLGLSQSKSRPDRAGRSMAISGLVCCLIGAVLATIFTVKIVHAINDCGGFNSNRSNTVFQQCVRDTF
jgi:hypothetical protein